MSGKTVEISFDDFAQPISCENEASLTPVPVGVYEALRSKYGDMLTAYDVSDLLHCSTKTVYSYCRKGVIPSVRIECRLYVPAVMLAKQIEAGNIGGVSNV